MPPKDAKKDAKKKLKPGDADKGGEYIRAQELDNLTTLLDAMPTKALNKHEIKGGKNMLHVAVDEENHLAVTILVDYGCKVNFRTKDMKTPLMIAIHFSNMDIYKFLLESGADIIIKDGTNNSALHIAAFRGHKVMADTICKEYQSIVTEQEEEKKRKEAAENEDDDDEDDEGLESSESKVTDQPSSVAPPEASIAEGTLATGASEAAGTTEGGDEEEEDEEEEETEKKGIKRDDIDFMEQLEWKNDAEETAFAVSVKMQWFEVATVLVEYGADPNTRTVNENTPLTRSAFDGRLDTTRWLLTYCKRPADIHAVNFNGESSILIAIKQRNFKVASFLMEKGANIEDKDSTGNTALLFGAQACNMEIVKYCVEQGKANVDTPNRWGMTALMYCARNSKGGLILDYLMTEAGCDINQVDKNYNNALMHACKKGNMTTATKLLAAGADWLQENDDGLIAKALVKPYSKDPERNDKMFADALRVHMSVDTVDCKYGVPPKPSWLLRQVQEEKDEAFRISEDTYITRMLEEEAEMMKQEAAEKARYEREMADIAEKNRKEKEAFEALPQKEKDKILRKRAKERAAAKAKAAEEAAALGLPPPIDIPDDSPVMTSGKKSPSNKNKTSPKKAR